MHLTHFSDYALRVVLYLGCHPGKLVSVDEISRAYGISRHHLVKVVQTLTGLGVVEAHAVAAAACGSPNARRRSMLAG